MPEQRGLELLALGAGSPLGPAERFDQRLDRALGQNMGGKAAIKRVRRAQPGAAEPEIAADMAGAAVEEPGGADIGKEADRGLRHRQEGARGRQPIGAVDRDPGAAAHRDPVDDRDVGLGKAVDLVDQPVFLAKEHRGQIGIAADAAPGLPDRAHIAAGAEGAPAGAADQDGAHRRVGGPGGERRGDAAVIGQGQRIQRLRPVERDRGEPARAPEQDLVVFVTHSTARAGGGR